MQGGEKQGKVQKLSKGEVLMLNIGSMCTGARVIAVSPNLTSAMAVLQAIASCVGPLKWCRWQFAQSVTFVMV